ncbi:hypothetical protein QAD02_018650 [Eretmocerus hayati]|uniref:Uncharacterized protein n=1 Tax=Eretmocerus hayati TaxID=131215 RepID=A0ACC2PIJ3_9HYME|nr:hypothetical protein QAD02_018650 [Eretmocerus hayati]
MVDAVTAGTGQGQQVLVGRADTAPEGGTGAEADLLVTAVVIGVEVARLIAALEAVAVHLVAIGEAGAAHHVATGGAGVAHQVEAAQSTPDAEAQATLLNLREGKDAENEEESEETRRFNLIISKELDEFLADPHDQQTKLLSLREDVSERVKLVLDAGLLRKSDRDELLQSIPRDGDLQLEAPILNQEMMLTLQKEEATRDNFFRQYQKIIGSTISEAASLLNTFTELAPRLGLEGEESKKDRQSVLKPLSNIIRLSSDLRHMITTARKEFLSEGHGSRMQKILKSVKTTQFLFGSYWNLNTEKVKKDHSRLKVLSNDPFELKKFSMHLSHQRRMLSVISCSIA